MDIKFLHRVIDQIVNETEVDHNKGIIKFPFKPYLTTTSPLWPYWSFADHCRDVYGLNNDEVKYVWKEYKNKIKNEIKKYYQNK